VDLAISLLKFGRRLGGLQTAANPSEPRMSLFFVGPFRNRRRSDSPDARSAAGRGGRHASAALPRRTLGRGPQAAIMIISTATLPPVASARGNQHQYSY